MSGTDDTSAADRRRADKRALRRYLLAAADDDPTAAVAGLALSGIERTYSLECEMARWALPSVAGDAYRAAQARYGTQLRTLVALLVAGGAAITPNG